MASDLGLALVAVAVLVIVARDHAPHAAVRRLPAVVFAPASATVRLERLPSGDLRLTQPAGVMIWRDGEGVALAVRGGATLEVGALAAPSVQLEARRIVVAGPLRARTVSLRADELLDLEAGAEVEAADVRLVGHVVVNTGVISADGPTGGRIELAGEKVMNQGALRARGFDGDGGRVRVLYGSAFVESARGSIDVGGADRGGTIRIAGKRGSTLFTSGTHLARGRLGGEIVLAATDVKLVVASLDVSGERGAGAIVVGGKDEGQGGIPTREILVRPGSVLRADADGEGPGGRILLAAGARTTFDGRASARGGRRGGDGGFVEISSAAELVWRGEVEADAPAGNAGHVLIDPKNITISDTTGSLLQLELLDPTPAAGDQFGFLVSSLSTGNVVVADPYDDFAGVDAGAAHLFRGRDGALLATLVGSKAGDKVGGGVTNLANGNYLVVSTGWDNGAVVDAGAVTWGSGTTGVAGVVSAANSLVGSTAGDAVGYIVTQPSGHYLVITLSWDNGALADAGAVTWCDGTTGRTGAVSAANSLVGGSAGDQVGGPVLLSNGNYVVFTPHWHSGTAADVGAVTWCSGTTGRTGVVSAANSLVGATGLDSVGASVVALTNGNYVVANSGWDDGFTRDVGAVTWGNGATGTAGVVSAANSLIGATAYDKVGSVRPLTNGNYVVSSLAWDNGAVADAGAVTWGNGATGTTGVVSTTNSLVGSTASDGVGSVYALANGNYVVNSPDWDNGTVAAAGAVTWGNGTTGTVGVVSSANSLVGMGAGDRVGSFFVTPLTNGNYVVASHNWSGKGAATWGNGTTGITGGISATNSLVGSAAGDFGNIYVVALTNGNYVVANSFWRNGTATRAGAVTWGNGATGISGEVSAANSLVGSQAQDSVGGSGRFGVVALTNGNYVVGTTTWQNDGVPNAGAATWGNGATGTTGVVSAANSLVGTTNGDAIGNPQALPGGKYAIASPTWSNGAVREAGAVTFSDGATGAARAIGPVSAANSLVGTRAGDQVGRYGASALPDGNYVVTSIMWDDGTKVDAGAVTGASGATGISGPVSALNSVIGPLANYSAAGRPGPLPGTFLATFDKSGSGRVFVGAINLDALKPEYAWLASQSVTIAPRLIAATLGHGQDVTLQASNDITVAGSVTVANPAGKGGHLTLAAGRGIAMGANLTTDDGDLTLTANDRAASGVVDQHREAGAGGIAWAPGVSVNAGAGAVEIAVRDGAGKTNRESGKLQLGQVAAATVVSRAQGSGLELSGAVAATGIGSAIVLVSDVSFEALAGASLSSPNGRYLIYAPSPAAAQTGAIPLSFAEFEKTYPTPPEPGNTGSGILFASQRPDGGFDLPDVGQPDTGTPDVGGADAGDVDAVDSGSDVPPPDAGPTDAAADAARPPANSGCSCATSDAAPSGGAANLWWLGALLLVFRRNRRDHGPLQPSR
jgi:MYXO-CTERM domain-containing protein